MNNKITLFIIYYILSLYILKLGEKMGDHSNQVTGFANEIQSLSTEKTRLQAQITEQNEENQRLQKLISMKNNSINEYNDKLKLNETEISRLRSQLDKISNDSTDNK